MNKSELIDHIADEADISKAAAGRALDATLQAITDSLKQSDPVQLVGFGTFLVRERAARSGRNPQTVPRFRSPPQGRPPSSRAGR